MTVLRPIPNYEDDYPPLGEAAPRNGNGTIPSGRIPPHDLEAERALVGAMLLNPAAIEAASNLTSSDYYKPAHGHIHNACVTLHAKGEPADPVTVADELHRDGLLDAIGGPPTLVELQTGCPATSNAGRYAAIVKDHADMRAVISVAADIADIGYSLPEKVDEAVTVVTGLLDRVVARRVGVNTTRDSYFVDARAVLDGERGPAPTILARSDGTVAMFYRGLINGVAGVSESGKSWISQQAAVETIKLGGHVFYEDFEKDAREVFDRMLKLGVTEDELVEFFHYKRREGPYTATDLATLRALADEFKPEFAVFDGVNAALMMHGANPNLAEDVARFYESAPRLLAVANAAVVVVDHDKKDAEVSTLGPGGSQHKRSGITGAAYKMHLTKRFTREHSGRGFLKVDKDAGGWVRAACPDSTSFADVEFEVFGGSVRDVKILASSREPVTPTAMEGVMRRTGHMAKASVVLRDAGVAGASVESVRAALKCNREYARDALRCLEAEGYATLEGEGNKARYFHVSSFTDGSASTQSFYEKDE